MNGRELCPVIKLRLHILFELINVFVRLLYIYLLVMLGSQVIIFLKQVLFIMITLIFWFGLKTKGLYKLMRL